MKKAAYRPLAMVFAVFGVCAFCFCLAGCKKRPPSSSQAQRAASGARMTVDVTSDIPEVQVLEEFNNESVSVAEPETVSVKAGSAVFIPPTPKELQAALKNAGYYTGAIDGKIGPKSQQAIRDFQRDNRLTVDGKVGKKTWAKLKTYLNDVGN